ncbi:MAG: hypothetical protein QF773_08410 [Lentisphaeria bacterium]|jgi:hypothetical protein|nr:hypothetical protein [Lentisphaeria bacterium]
MICGIPDAPFHAAGRAAGRFRNIKPEGTGGKPDGGLTNHDILLAIDFAPTARHRLPLYFR